MKDYYDRDYKLIRSKSYLVWGLVMAALALVMLIITLLTLEENASIALAATGFGAAAVWAIGAVVCIRVYYRDNRLEIREKAKEIAETVENAVKK
ncbi:MAG: hypothetical protein J6A05_09030 [Oscillospiraceae bacterium]|nr:hypothetical protein [Oscillospiraceae bacterium]